MAACGRVRSANQCWFSGPKSFCLLPEEIHCGQNYCGKSCYCQYYPAITDILQKILEYLSKNLYNSTKSFLRTDRFLQIFNFSIPSCTSWPTNSSSNVSTSCHSSNQPFSNGPTLTVPVGTGKVAQNRIYYPSSEKSHKSLACIPVWPQWAPYGFQLRPQILQYLARYHRYMQHKLQLTPILL